ncbi:MAG: DUF2142 domain-containing protein, partial [Atopobiaceae bacterium]|nr:DUF2142 domain-containing protein [Atopobiaceae bacterium]
MAAHFKETTPTADTSSSIDVPPLYSVGKRLLILAATLVVSCALAAGLSLIVNVALNGGEHGWFNRFWFAFFAASGFVAGSFALNRDWLATKPENLYLIVVLCVTMLFSWTISVRQVAWDVGTHYSNVLTFADWEGEVELSTSDHALVYTAPVDVEAKGLLEQIDKSEDVLDSSSADVAEVRERSKNPVWYVTSIEYVPYALAMKACKLLGVSFTHTLVVVRMAGALFYSLVTYLGMRKLRQRKMLYAAMALLPTSVFLAADLSYSYWLFSLCLYGFACLLGMLQGSVRVSVWSLVKMLGALFLGMLPRVVYFPLMFLCLLIPTDKFPSHRFAQVYRGLLVGAALAAFGVWLVPRLIAGLGTGDTRGGEVNPSAQIAYILSHPGDYAATFARFSLPPLAMEGGAPDKEGVNLVSGFLSVEASPGLLMNYGYLPRPHVAYTVVMWVVLAWTALTDKDHELKMG